jgi:hypothetical protein
LGSEGRSFDFDFDLCADSNRARLFFVGVAAACMSFSFFVMS